jgi:hypothetical protein
MRDLRRRRRPAARDEAGPEPPALVALRPLLEDLVTNPGSLPMASKISAPAPAPQPREAPFLSPDEVDRDQRLLCGRRRDCLAVAARSPWPAFSCAGCGAFTAPDPHNLAAETAALARFGAALWRVAKHDAARAAARIQDNAAGDEPTDHFDEGDDHG